MSKLCWSLALGALLLLIGSNEARADNLRICVEVAVTRAATTPKTAPAPPAPVAPPAPTPKAGATPLDPMKLAPLDAEPKGARPDGDDPALENVDSSKRPSNLPIGQRPPEYLKRLLEYFVSHEKGFVAVQTDCQHTVHVELYPLVEGWTVFIRYTGTGREERVDRLLPDELSQFAERAVTALLYGKPISATINRENVLVSDSKEYAQKLRGTHHFILGLGTQLRVGKLAGAVTDSSDARLGQSATQTRYFSPVTFFMGYRGRFESWGLEANALAGIGTTQTALKTNPGGGHVDLEADGAVQLHFLHYFDPRGVTSFYAGGGATLELLWFQAIRAEGARADRERSNLLSGGLDVDLVAGWEFMRASSAQFFLQAEAQAPAYVMSTENDDGALHSWFPALGVKMGMLF